MVLPFLADKPKDAEDVGLPGEKIYNVEGEAFIGCDMLTIMSTKGIYFDENLPK